MSARNELAHTYDLKVIRSAVNKVKHGVESGLNGTLREKLSGLGDQFDRDELLAQIEDLDSNEFDDFRNSVDRQARRDFLEKRKSRWSYYEEFEYSKSETLEEQLRSLVTQITTKEAAYYDAHFKFSNSGCQLYHVEHMDGPLGKVRDQADDSRQAERIFASEVRDRDDIDDVYAEAAEGEASIVGNLVSAPRPRLIWFDNNDHVFIEFWSLGTQNTVFDGQNGYSFDYQERVRSAVRIHLNEGKMELFNGKDTKNHKNTLVHRIEDLMNPAAEGAEKTATDGGKQETTADNVLRHNSITEDEIWDVMKEIGILVTMEGFGGRKADTRLSAVQNRDVRKDDTHDDLNDDNRPIEISNIQMFVDDLNGRCELIDPEEVFDRISFDEDAKREDMKEQVAEEFDYDNIDHVTVSLNSDNNLFRIQKERCTPVTRRKLFDLATKGLSW